MAPKIRKHGGVAKKVNKIKSRQARRRKRRR